MHADSGFRNTGTLVCEKQSITATYWALQEMQLFMRKFHLLDETETN